MNTDDRKHSSLDSTPSIADRVSNALSSLGVGGNTADQPKKSTHTSNTTKNRYREKNRMRTISRARKR